MNGVSRRLRPLDSAVLFMSSVVLGALSAASAQPAGLDQKLADRVEDDASGDAPA